MKTSLRKKQCAWLYLSLSLLLTGCAGLRSTLPAYSFTGNRKCALCASGINYTRQHLRASLTQSRQAERIRHIAWQEGLANIQP